MGIDVLENGMTLCFWCHSRADEDKLFVVKIMRRNPARYGWVLPEFEKRNWRLM